MLAPVVSSRFADIAAALAPLEASSEPDVQMAESLVALVTGGAQGLGAAITVELLKKGYKVCVADLQEEKGRQFVKEQQEIYGAQNAIFTACDVTKDDSYKGIFEFTLKEFKRIDVVVNNAGIIHEQNARKTVDVNLMGPILGCQLAFQYMGKSKGGKGGIVINMASIVGFLPCHALPIYCATKHAVVGLTRSYGTPYHLERDGIIFSALCPSFTDTAILESCRTNSLIPEFNAYEEHDIMTPEFVAEGVMKLLEDRINGSTLMVTKKRGHEYVGYQEVFKDFIL